MRIYRRMSFVPALVVFCAVGLGWSQSLVDTQTTPQTQGQTTSQAEPSAPGQGPVLQNPTEPETQPSLKVDRDPVLSPDIEDDQPVSPTIPLSQNRANQIQKLRGGVFTMRQNVDEVVLNCTVVDSRGRLVTDLTRNDFKVWEDNAPQTISFFQHADVPVSMGILVDNSGSMRDKLPAVREAALDLVRASNPNDEAFIVNFSDEAYLDQGFTSDISRMEAALSHIDARGGTALYDAVVASADELAKHAKNSKQVLLIITDGEDDASTLNLQQAIRRVQDLHGPEIYAIGLLYNDSGEEARTARKALEALTAETGGLAYFPRSLRDVDEIAEEVATDIRNQYSIGYHPTKPFRMGGFRTVRVEASAPGHGRLTVRTRTGYYATVSAAHKANVHQR
ncbi:MAG: VWA domain-containing protein [Acidobacteriaceae bacterium]